MAKKIYIVEEPLTLRTRNGKQISATLRIGTPLQERDGAWKCSLSVGKWKNSTIYGVSALQALGLAISDLRWWLEREERSRRTVSYPTTGENLLEVLTRWWNASPGGPPQNERK